MLLNSRQQIRIYDREDNNYSANYLCSEKEAARQFTAADTSRTRAVYTTPSPWNREVLFSFFTQHIFTRSCFHFNVNKP